MAERSAITQVVQLGIETTPGIAVAASKKMAALDFETKIENVDEMFRPAGFKFTTVTAENKEWTSSTLKGQPTYTEIVYPLSSVIVAPSAPTEFLDTAIHTGVYKWVFEPSTSSPDTLNTFTVEQGDSVRAQKYTNCIIHDFGLNVSRDKTELTGKSIGQLFQDGITLTAARVDAGSGTTSGSAVVTDTSAVSTDVGKTITGTGIPANTTIISVVPGTSLTMSANATATATVTVTIGAPPQVALIPIIAPQCDVFFDSTSGALGTTKLGRLFDWKFSLQNRTGPFWVIDSSKPSFGGTVETAPKVTTKVLVEADAAGMALLPLLRSSTTYFMRLLAKGAALYSAGVYVGSPLTYQYQQDMAVQVVAAGPINDHEGIYALEFDLETVHDGGWGKALHIEVQNKLSGF